jgi:arginase family enzyme
VGGDQSVTLANLRGVRAAKRRAVGLIHIDAFHDTTADLDRWRCRLPVCFKSRSVNCRLSF